MASLTYTLVGDGPSDKRLMAAIDWVLAQLTDCPFTGQWADTRVLPPPGEGIAARIAAALEFFPCDLLFIHRDSEGQNAQLRREEISSATEDLSIPWVAVVPIRMQEAWLLIDEPAIRTAAGNPSGRVRLALPRIGELEDLGNPKELLYSLLRVASEHTGRKLRKFNVQMAAYRVAELIGDYSVLRRTSAFEQFEAELQTVLERHGWHSCK